MSLFGAGPSGAKPAFGSSPAFGSNLFSTPATGGGIFGSSAPSTGGGLFGAATPAFGAQTPAASTGAGLFGASPSTGGGLLGGASTPAFGQTGATPGGGLFGATTPAFGQTGTPATPSLFGAQPAAGGGGLLGSTPSLLGQSSTPAFGQPQPTAGFGQTGSMFRPPTLSTSTAPFGSSLVGQQPQQPSIFGQTQPSSSPFGFGQSQPSSSPFNLGQTQAGLGMGMGMLGGAMQPITQMAPVNPIAINLPDRDVQSVVGAYDENPNNPNFRFRHLFLSVTDPAARLRPPNVPEESWTEAIRRLEAMDSVDRERLWPEVVTGFNGLAQRLKLQDDVLAGDQDRLRTTQASVKQLQMHCDADTRPRIKRLRLRQQELQRRLLRMMRIAEMLEGRGVLSRLPLSFGEVQLSERLRSLHRKLSGPSGDLPRRVDALLATSRMKSATPMGGMGDEYSLAQVDEASIEHLQQVLRQQTEAFERLSMLLKKDSRDLDIILSEPIPPASGGLPGRLGARSILVNPGVGGSLLGGASGELRALSKRLY